MSISALIRRMTEAGAPPEAIALAVEEIEALQDCLDARRASDRDRKRAQRERRKSADVTGQSEDSHGTVAPQGFPKVSPHTPLPNPSKSSPLNPPQKRGAAIEIPDWMPSSYAEFRAMRKSMRNVPFGDGAERRVIAKLTKLRGEGHDPEKLLSKAIERGHRTVFEDETTRVGRVKVIRPLQPEEIPRAIAFWRDQGNLAKVAELESQLAQVRTA